ncbi:MAG: hypothetical protein KDH96_02045 [Candidatus Riesia sp.]|nr:hypothetical protein [Candidatus Riesia sp.]
MAELTPEQKDKHLRAIEKIEQMKRPQKWRAIKKLFFELHPEFTQIDADFAKACQEIREKNPDKIGMSKDGTMRNTMKIPQFLYNALIKLDPELMIEMSGRNGKEQELIGKQLYKAFPEYRTVRIY